MPEISTQAQSVGDLIGRAVRLYRQNLLVIVQVLLLPSAGATLGKISLQWGIIHLRDLNAFLPAVAFCLVGFGLSFWFLWILTLRQIALVRLLVGEEKDFATAYKGIKQRGWTTFCVFLLMHFMVVLNVALFVAELVLLAVCANLAPVSGLALLLLAVLGFLGSVAGALYVGLFAFLDFAMIALDHQKLGALLKEGAALIGRDLRRTTSFTILLMIVVAALVPPLALPLVGLSAFDAFKPSHAAQAWLGIGKYSLFTLVVAQAWESFVNMVIWPVMFFGYGFLYLDLKMRQYASDLVQNLERLQYGRA